MNLNNRIEQVVVPCPRCGDRSGNEVRLFFGLRNGIRYRVGDRLQWREGRPPANEGRPPQGDLEGQGQTVCMRCGLEFLVTVHVRTDTIVAVQPDVDKRPYIQD